MSFLVCVLCAYSANFAVAAKNLVKKTMFGGFVIQRKTETYLNLLYLCDLRVSVVSHPNGLGTPLLSLLAISYPS